MGLRHPEISSYTLTTQGPFEPTGHPARNKRIKIEYLHCEKTGPPGGKKGKKHKNQKVGRTENKKIPLNQKIEYLHGEKTGPPAGIENEKGNKHKNKQVGRTENKKIPLNHWG